jgi:hypothetical protein
MRVMSFAFNSAAEAARETDLSLAERIVVTLREYDRAIPIEFLAEVLGQRPSLVNFYLDALEREHVVKRLAGDKGFEKVELVEE